MEVVSRYMLLGNMRIVAEQTGLEYPTLMEWKKSDWWPELVDQLKRQKKHKQNESITKIVEQSLDVMQDRLDNGDFVFNQKTGQVVRKPVSIKDVTVIANQLMQRQEAIETRLEQGDSAATTVQETLTLLAKEFQKWTKRKPVEYVDVVSPELTNAI